MASSEANSEEELGLGLADREGRPGAEDDALQASGEDGFWSVLIGS